MDTKSRAISLGSYIEPVLIRLSAAEPPLMIMAMESIRDEITITVTERESSFSVLTNMQKQK